jgi:N-acyl-D-amino-acid deacylase
LTGLTAEFFDLEDRGFIKVGYKADLTIFDPDRVLDLADWDNPTTPSKGIDSVLVNGVAVWADGGPTGTRPGQVVRKRRHEVSAIHA